MKTRILFSILFIFLLLGRADPQVQTLILQPGPAAGKDAVADSFEPNRNFEGWDDFIASAWTNGGQFLVERSYLQMDFSSIPAGSTIVSAVFTFMTNLNSANYQLNSGDNTSYLCRVTENWDENQLTWNNQPVYSTVNPVIIPMVSSNYDPVYVDVTAHVVDMVQHPETNFGWVFMLQTEDTYRCLVFASSDNIITNWRPLLTIKYLQCPNPQAKFIYLVDDSVVRFFDSSSSAATWYWDFGDGYMSVLKNPVHQYQVQGKYLACLTVTDSCGSGTICDTVIDCKSPDPHFTCATADHFVQFHDTSNSPLTWFWDFNDGFFSDLHNPYHYFKEFGIYYICLRVTNSCTAGTFCDSVYIKPNSIEEYGRNQIVIYPNPVSDRLYLKTGIIRSGKVEITSSLGSLVYKGIIENNANEANEIRVNDLPPGMYYLKVISDDQLLTRTFLVLRK